MPPSVVHGIPNPTPNLAFNDWLDSQIPGAGFRLAEVDAILEPLKVRHRTSTVLTENEIAFINKSSLILLEQVSQLLLTNEKIITSKPWQRFLKSSLLGWPDNAAKVLAESKPLHYLLRQASRAGLIDELERLPTKMTNIVFGVGDSGTGSKDSEHDLKLLLSIPPAKLPTADILKKWYDEHSFIPSLEALENKRPDSLHEKLVYALSKCPSPPRGNQRERMVALIAELPESLGEQFYATISVLHEESEIIEPLTRIASELLAVPPEDIGMFEKALEAITASARNRTVSDILAGRDQSLLLEFSYLGDLVQRPELQTKEIFSSFGANKSSDLAVAIERYDMVARAKTQKEVTFDVAAEKFLKNIDVKEPLDKALLERACEICLESSMQNEELQNLSDEQFAARVETLRDTLDNSRLDPITNESAAAFLATAREGVRRVYGIYPHNTQSISIVASILFEDRNVHSGNEKIRGLYTQIGTGEGKSLILAVLNMFYALRGENTVITSSNAFLAQRDADKSKSLFRLFGIEVGAYQNDRDYLKDRFPQVLFSTISDISFAQLAAGLDGEIPLGGRSLDRIFLDEGDSAALDEAKDNCRISSPSFNPYRTELLKAIWKIAESGAKTDDIVSQTKVSIANKELLPSDAELRMLANSAQTARQLKFNVDYTIQDFGGRSEIVIVDKDQTGRLKVGSSWGRGLDPFLSFKHPGTHYKRVKGVSAQQSNRSLIASFRRTMICTGTAGNVIDRNELQNSYALRGFDVPRHFPLLRRDHTQRVFSTDAEQIAYVTKMLDARGPRACSVVRRSIKDALGLYQQLHQQVGASLVQVLTDSVNRLPGESAELTEQEEQQLRGSNDTTEETEDEQSVHSIGVAKEMEIIRQAARAGMITVATRTMGRGQDIRPELRVLQAGGYMVIVLDLDADIRSQQQVFGRAGRQGEPGDAYGIYSAESDHFLGTMPTDAQWLLRACKNDSVQFFKFVNFWRDQNSVSGAISRNIKVLQASIYESLQTQYFKDLRGLRNGMLHPDESDFPPKDLARTWSKISHEIDIALELREREAENEAQVSSNRSPPEPIRVLIMRSFDSNLAPINDERLIGQVQKMRTFAFDKLVELSHVYRVFKDLNKEENRTKFLAPYQLRLTEAYLRAQDTFKAKKDATRDDIAYEKGKKARR